MSELAQKKGSTKQLTYLQGCGKMETNERWIMCPVCGRGKVLKVLPTTEVKNLPVFCKRCVTESVVNILPRA